MGLFFFHNIYVSTSWLQILNKMIELSIVLPWLAEGRFRRLFLLSQFWHEKFDHSNKSC